VRIQARRPRGGGAGGASVRGRSGGARPGVAAARAGAAAGPTRAASPGANWRPCTEQGRQSARQPRGAGASIRKVRHCTQSVRRRPGCRRCPRSAARAGRLSWQPVQASSGPLQSSSLGPAARPIPASAAGVWAAVPAAGWPASDDGQHQAQVRGKASGSPCIHQLKRFAVSPSPQAGRSQASCAPQPTPALLPVHLRAHRGRSYMYIGSACFRSAQVHKGAQGTDLHWTCCAGQHPRWSPQAPRG